jgi:hypothetical protein
VGGCGLISREAQVEKIDDAIAVSVQADVQNVAQQLRIWYAGAVSDPVLVNSGGKYYLCAPEDAATIDGCTSAGPVSNGVVLVLARTGAANFCVQGSLTETGEVWHQAVSGGVQQGAC